MTPSWRQMAQEIAKKKLDPFEMGKEKQANNWRLGPDEMKKISHQK